MTSTEIVHSIHANVDQWYRDEITREAFDARQRELWAIAERTRQMQTRVLALLRQAA